MSNVLCRKNFDTESHLLDALLLLQHLHVIYFITLLLVIAIVRIFLESNIHGKNSDERKGNCPGRLSWRLVHKKNEITALNK